MMNGNGKAKHKATDDELSWDYTVACLIDEAHQIRAALDEHVELGSADWTAALTLWSLQWQGFQLVAQGDPDPCVRARFEAALTERKRVMDALLVKMRAQNLGRAS
jgi:hypothetical protein